MAANLTPDTLAELRRLLAEATPAGEWRAVEGDLEGGTLNDYIATLLTNRQNDGTSSGRLFLTLAPNDIDPERGAEVVPALTGDGPRAEANANLIAATINALPALLDAAEAARETTSAEVGLRSAVSGDTPCRCGCPADLHVGEIGCPCGLPDEPPCAGEDDIHSRRLDGWWRSQIDSLLAEHPAPAPEAEVTAGEHTYTSTAYHHGRHDQCRQTCKFCAEMCVCACHTTPPADAAEVAADERGTNLIAAERRRQIEVEGYSADHDREHSQALWMAASCYLTKFPDLEHSPPPTWPWRDEDWKPTTRINNLVKAGALIAAEIDRLLPATPPADDATPAPAEPKTAEVDAGEQRLRGHLRETAGGIAIADLDALLDRERRAERERVLHQAWLRVHIHRFDGRADDNKAVGPDSFYNGVLQSQRQIEDLGHELGVHRLYDSPAARIARADALGAAGEGTGGAG